MSYGERCSSIGWIGSLASYPRQVELEVKAEG
jgi:hypothetical protein